MARELKQLSLFSAFILGFLSFCVMFNGTEARPLSGSRLHGYVPQDISEAFRVYSLGAAENSGPSRGVGHKYQNVQIMADIKESGPSPGKGHKYQNTQTMGAVDQPGPSRSEGHKYFNGNKP